MKALEEKIREKGKILPNDVLKIDSFLNHQIDTLFLDEMGKEFYRIFKDVKPTRILTIEASGIAVAIAAAKYFDNIPVVFAKKGGAANMSQDVYGASLYSYTRGKQVFAYISKEYLSNTDKVLLIDDFLANGQALGGLISICQQADAEVLGCGVVVEKAYQPGGKALREQGYRIESLARIKSMSDDGQIEFVED